MALGRIRTASSRSTCWQKKKEARKSRHFENFHEKKRSGVSVREVTVSPKTFFWPKNRRFFGKTSKLKFLDDEKNVLRVIGVLRGAVQPRLQRRRGRGRGCQVEVRVEALHQHFPSGFSAEAPPDARPARPARARCCPGPAAGAAYTLRDKIFECARQKF